MWGSPLRFLCPQHCPPALSPLLRGPPASMTSPLCPQAEQVPWLWAWGIYQTFSAMPELPVLPRNVGTGQGQAERRRRVPGWGVPEANATCRLRQASLLKKAGATNRQRGCPPTWVAVGQPGRTLSLKHVPQLGRQRLEPLPHHVIRKPGVPVGTCGSTTPFSAF